MVKIVTHTDQFWEIEAGTSRRSLCRFLRDELEISYLQGLEVGRVSQGQGEKLELLG